MNRSFAMISSSLSSRRTTSPAGDLSTDSIRALVAEYLGVGLDRVTDDARFDDFGIDWLDRLEMMMIIEDRLVGIEISDDHIDQIESVGDLVRVLTDITPPSGGPRLWPKSHREEC
jgi:acyl carrier protein